MTNARFGIALAIAALLTATGCWRSGAQGSGGPPDADTDSDTDTDTDIDIDTDTDSDTDVDSDTDTETETETDTAPPVDCGTEILVGDVSITSPADIAALAGVTWLQGSLSISGTTLENVDGMESLQCVDGYLTIDSNYSWGGDDWLDGLSGLKWIGYDLGVDFNYAADSAPLGRVGLSGLERVDGAFDSMENALSSLTGLEALQQVGFQISILRNSGLQSLTGLDGLEAIEDPDAWPFRIVGNPDLVSLDGLENLASLAGLEIDHNPSLADIGALGGVTAMGDLTVTDNLSLPTCSVVQLVQQMEAIGWDGAADISGNGADPPEGCEGVDPEAGADVDTDVDTDVDADPQCDGLGDLTACSIDSTVEAGFDLSYDICVAERCVSPGTSGMSSNTRGPAFPSPSDVAPSGYVRTEPVADEPIVDDPVTGLTWQGCAAGQSGADCEIGSASTLGFTAALQLCDALDWGGYDDWYMPDPYELHSLVAYGAAEPPAIDAVAFPGVPTYWDAPAFWSSNSSGSMADPVGLTIGFDNAYIQTSTDPAAVRCVRRDPLSLPERFSRNVVDGDPVVEDAITGLAWQGCAAGETGDHCTGYYAFGFDWEGAAAYCETLAWGGASDWRLPDVKELFGLYRRRDWIGPAHVDPVAFPSAPWDHFWSSTEQSAPESTGAYAVDFTGNSADPQDKADSALVRCVRELP
jgi:hypothetical protein